MTINELISQAGIKMVAELHHENPNMADSENMDHWRCVLKAGRSQFTVYFSMGAAHNGKAPKAADVLDCLASDACGFANARDFADWASEYGYDPDSRKAYHTYRIVEKQAKKLRKFLGESAYETLLWGIEQD